MSKKEHKHFYLVSGHVTAQLTFEQDKKLQTEVNTFPVQATIATDKEDTIPLKYIVMAQQALGASYEQKLPKGQDVIHKILDIQVHNLVDLGHMTQEEFYEDIEDPQSAND